MKDYEVISLARKSGICISVFDLDDWFMLFSTPDQKKHYFVNRELPFDIDLNLILKARELNSKNFGVIIYSYITLAKS